LREICSLGGITTKIIKVISVKGLIEQRTIKNDKIFFLILRWLMVRLGIHIIDLLYVISDFSL
jgi:hypothetical protein